MSNKNRPLLKSYSVGWADCNWGIPRGFHQYRRDAIRACVEATGEPWSKCRKYMEVRKVRLVEVKQRKASRKAGGQHE